MEPMIERENEPQQFSLPPFFLGLFLSLSHNTFLSWWENSRASLVFPEGPEIARFPKGILLVF